MTCDGETQTYPHLQSAESLSTEQLPHEVVAALAEAKDDLCALRNNNQVCTITHVIIPIFISLPPLPPSKKLELQLQTEKAKAVEIEVSIMHGNVTAHHTHDAQ